MRIQCCSIVPSPQKSAFNRLELPSPLYILRNKNSLAPCEVRLARLCLDEQKNTMAHSPYPLFFLQHRTQCLCAEPPPISQQQAADCNAGCSTPANPRRSRISTMALSKRRVSTTSCIEGPPGKRRRFEVDGPLILINSPGITLPDSPKAPTYPKPKANFLSLFTSIPDFRDALRKGGNLTAYQYTRLRMTCRTVADTWKPFPHDPSTPDTQDPYFVGLKPVKCDELNCPNTSARVAVRRCFGRYHPGIFSGCNKYLCIQCVWQAQQAYDLHKSPHTEMYYCYYCSRDRNILQQMGQCDCGLQNRENINHQPYSDWQCMACRASQFRVFKMQARRNLENLEATNMVLPRDPRCKDNTPSLKRWICTTGRVRNNCPGCGRHCKQLLGQFATRGSGLPPLPRGMIRQCMVCLGRRP